MRPLDELKVGGFGQATFLVTPLLAVLFGALPTSTTDDILHHIDGRFHYCSRDHMPVVPFVYQTYL